MQPDQSREGVTGDKIAQFFRLMMPRNTKTLARLRRFSDLDLDAIRAATGVTLRGLILDVDDTMGAHHGALPEAAHRVVSELIARGVRLAIYSNARADVNPQRAADIERLRSQGVVVLGGDIPAKPDVAGFSRALAALAPLGAHEVAMIGDNYFTDGGAIRAGVHFIKVVPVSATLGDTPLENLSRGANIALRVAFDVLSRLHEHLPGQQRALRL
jgi:predicted HAD superfamily phosphohydrolase YqeG